MSVDDSQEVILGHRGLWPWARSWVAMRTCWERIPNKVFPDLEGELKLSKVTVPVVLWLRSGLKYSVIISKVRKHL